MLLVSFPEVQSMPIPMVMVGHFYYPSDRSIIMMHERGTSIDAVFLDDSSLENGMFVFASIPFVSAF